MPGVDGTQQDLNHRGGKGCFHGRLSSYSEFGVLLPAEAGERPRYVHRHVDGRYRVAQNNLPRTSCEKRHGVRRRSPYSKRSHAASRNLVCLYAHCPCNWRLADSWFARITSTFFRPERKSRLRTPSFRRALSQNRRDSRTFSRCCLNPWPRATTEALRSSFRAWTRTGLPPVERSQDAAALSLLKRRTRQNAQACRSRQFLPALSVMS